MAATYHWTTRYIERELTDELLVLYLDEEADRVQARFVEAVEASRMGVIFASNGKAHASWTRQLKGHANRNRGLTGQALEQAVQSFAAMHNEYVVMGAR